jgi:poly [ADP-ribose] polymerase
VSDTITKERLIYTDLNANNNKFWHAEVIGTTVTVNFGRVGDTGQFKTHECGSTQAAQHKFELLVNSKLRKGYTRQQTMAEGKQNVAFVAKFQIQHNNDKETTALIDFLVTRNIHKIEGTTSIRLEAGRLTTPLGPVTPAGLDEAEALLVKMAKHDKEFADYVNLYMRIVPRDIGRRRIDPSALFGTASQIEAEQATIDSLRAVVKDLEQKATTDGPPVFETKLEIVDGSRSTFERIRKIYQRGLNSRHQSYGMNLYRVWEMHIQAMENNFESKLGNIKELWHGTKDANLLSILKNGYIIPKASGSIAITGRMFGDGIYFSDQSTKSLNYASGYWGGGRSQRCFMIFNDVAMGREHIPRSSIRSIPRGYDSCFAKAGQSGVMNNEMIVYRTSQVKPTFLCEFR